MTDDSGRTEERLITVDDDEGPGGPRIVVGVDCSAGSRAALLFALDDAARRGVHVEAATGYPPPADRRDF